MDNLAHDENLDETKSSRSPASRPAPRDAEVVRRIGLSVLPGMASFLDEVLLSPASRFGSLVGSSSAMRATYAVLERVSASDVTVLIEGETGTGKERAAQSIHAASSRAGGPLVIVDCGAVPANLLESELFGHEKGAFTGAEARRVGAFEEASGGTLFLDEIGELPLELQAKLLRALESREIRRVGANRHFPVNLRVIAATNRDLRAEVAAGSFRSDLYYRLAVVKVTLPTLRERPEDLPLLVDELLRQLGASPEAAAAVKSPDFMLQLMSSPWPGNVRELRNAVEARLVLSARAAVAPIAPTTAPASEEPAPSTGELLQFSDARKQAMEGFERVYLEDLMRRFPGKVAHAAQAAGLDRVYLYRLLRKQGMKI